jgi:excisionase family DNA binding protein
VSPREAGRSPRSLTIADLAERWHVAARTVRRKIDGGELPAFRVGNLVRIWEEDAEAFERKNRIR